jgi:hypothetical protein
MKTSKHTTEKRMPVQVQKHIVARATLRGETHGNLAREYGVSRERISQLVKRLRGDVTDQWLDPRMNLTFDELLARMEE